MGDGEVSFAVGEFHAAFGGGELHASGAGGVEFEGGAVVEAGTFVAGDGGGVVNCGGRPEGVPAEEGAEGERGGEAGPSEGTRPVSGRSRQSGLFGGRRCKRHDGRGAIEGGVDLAAKFREFAEEAEGLLEAGDGGGVTRIGAEPLGKFALTSGRKAIVALCEPGDRGVFDGGGGRIDFHEGSFIAGAASTRPRASK